MKIKGDWNEILNDCRATVGKAPLSKEPSQKFKENILLAEHSVIRSMSFKWIWENIPHWVGVHWVRHKWECFVRTQRTDRAGVPREELSQVEPQNFIGEGNIQHLIDTLRKRLCFQAAKETREYAEDLKYAIFEEGQKEIANVLVPNCVYRCGCPEKTGAPCEFFNKLKKDTNGQILTDDIQKRYEIYNKWFYSNNMHKIISN